MTPARLDEIVAALRSPSGFDGSAYEMAEALMLLADIRDAERAFRKALVAYEEAFAERDPDIDVSADGPLWAAVKKAKSDLCALGVTP